MISTTYLPPYQLPAMTLTARAGKLILLDWFDDKTSQLLAKIPQSCQHISRHNLGLGDDEQLLLSVCHQLDEYFLGRRQVFDIPLDFSCGTAFQQQVWQALLTIEYGSTISYAELAKSIGRPKSFRACANANGKNPISLIIPCHRVIASDGSLGGYTGGTAIKQTLLMHEAAAI